LLAALLWIVIGNAAPWFWPERIWELRLADGRAVVGEIVHRQTGAFGAEAWLVKIGSRELTGEDHLVIREEEIIHRSRPENAVVVRRIRDGDVFGRVVAATGFAGEALEVEGPDALDSLLAAAARERHALDEDRQRFGRTRRPLTDVEQRLVRLHRTSGEIGRRSDLARLERERTDLAHRLEPRLAELEQSIALRREKLANAGITVANGSGAIRVGLDSVEAVLWSNRLGPMDRVTVAVRRAVHFVTSWPREANTEGGVYPALFGTVLMVILMSIAVMPLGVLAAVYLYEYAGDGPLLRLADRGVNNLAGVPSIVFGMFGLAFFVYGIGGAIDRTAFPDNLPSPTFGTGGILWASLTLAVLTIPVVVVATREGLQSVPTSRRDAARALGATRLQTLRQVVLPAAVPGMLTGFILAVSRAAGEVAPLMLTGVVKMANSLPVNGEPPFLHLQRKFMHLGFHVYDVSMQSPNVEAAKPMAFASALVLLLLVVAVNLTAIVIRRRVRASYRVLEG
jgi:phosphate transport system permease protein